MSEHDPVPERDPYGVRPDPSPHPSPGRPADRQPEPRRPDRPPLTPEEKERLERRRSLSLVLLALTATFSAIVMPPIGLAMGVFTLVVALRRRRHVPRGGRSGAMQGIQISGAIVAIIIGAVLTTVTVILSTELRDAQQCLAGANTRVAQERCQDELREDLRERFR